MTDEVTPARGRSRRAIPVRTLIGAVVAVVVAVAIGVLAMRDGAADDSPGLVGLGLLLIVGTLAGRARCPGEPLAALIGRG